MKKYVQRGFLAKAFGGQHYALEVCDSAAGFYLGTMTPDGEPYSREGEEYWLTRKEAEQALLSPLSTWTQRP